MGVWIPRGEPFFRGFRWYRVESMQASLAGERWAASDANREMALVVV